MKYLPLMAITGLMAGCSSVNSLTDTTNLVDYSNHKSVKLLEVPAGLDKPVFDKTYVTNVSDQIETSNTVVLDGSVPLIDGSMTTIPASAGVKGVVAAGSILIVKQGAQLVLKSSDVGASLLKRTTEALKPMGLTVISSNQATGVITVRDRSLVSDQDSLIGAFLNRTMGKVNEGAEYQMIVKGDSVAFTDMDSQSLPGAEARSLLTRLKKELTSS
ncbi:hypothetical protein [Leucothrix arctica]|uniref:Uncharacterized protein n=1 Tax=Leucothrix arctica TaxID=1481894 RepID=A0A317C626_9GAMM|nr:hypothetical protein [Leucothrix arctica]PWQ94086.1 hypothetical protein DKT75_16230 [Leucothrix arctica]